MNGFIYNEIEALKKKGFRQLDYSEYDLTMMDFAMEKHDGPVEQRVALRRADSAWMSTVLLNNQTIARVEAVSADKAVREAKAAALGKMEELANVLKAF